MIAEYWHKSLKESFVIIHMSRKDSLEILGQLWHFMFAAHVEKRNESKIAR